MTRKEKIELCEAARQIQDILQRYDLDLVIWPNVQQEDCIWAVYRGCNPWTGVRVATVKK